MSDLLCLECGHEVEHHSQDPDGVGSCIQGWSKRSAKNQCVCELTPDRAEVLALSNKIEAITHQRDEAREGWEYARLTSQQWQAAYNELLTKSQVHIESATGANFDVRTLEPREATPIYCDHSRWREAERALDEAYECLVSIINEAGDDREHPNYDWKLTARKMESRARAATKELNPIVARGPHL